MGAESISNISVCVVAILRNEEKFLDEWLVYHRIIGINHFFLYDDDPKLSLQNFMLPHSDYTTVIPWYGKNKPLSEMKNQIQAYLHAVNNCISGYDWVIFLDGDEFVVIKRHKNVQHFLSEFGDASAVSLNWHIFGHNGFYEDPERLVTTSLIRRMLKPSLHVKTFTRTNAIASIPSPHYCELKCGKRVDANNLLYTEEHYSGKSDVAHINHYQCRSFKRWMARVERGDVNFNTQNSTAEHRWRLDGELCLRKFVTTVARDKNEYIDDYMSGYRYDIYENIVRLNRNESSFIPKNTPLEMEINLQLETIAELIISNINCTENIGLLNGKTGIAVFLFHYAQYSCNAGYQRLAEKIIEEISETIDLNTSIDYAEGLAGYGIAIEHLVASGFIKTDTNEELKDIDDLLHYHLINNSLSTLDIYGGITGLGKYYAARLNNPINYIWHQRERKNRDIITQIIELLGVSYSSYLDTFSVIDFLCEAYSCSEDMLKVKNCLDYAVNKLEANLFGDMQLKDGHEFYSLNSIFLLSKAFEKTGDPIYTNKADDILKKNEKSYSKDIKGLVQNGNSLKLWLLYKQSYNIFKKDNLKENAINWLNSAILENKSYLVSEFKNRNLTASNINISTGFAGRGLALLAAVDRNESNWVNLLHTKIV